MKGVFIALEPMGIEDLNTISDMFDNGGVLCPTTARMLNANIVIGDPIYLHKLRGLLKAGVLEQTIADTAGLGLSDSACYWLASGDRGTSSNTIFSVVTGVNAMNDWAYDKPRDVADLIRCIRLLEACPEIAAGFYRVTRISSEWAALHDNWDHLVATLERERPDFRTASGSAPETRQLLEDIYKQSINYEV